MRTLAPLVFLIACSSDPVDATDAGTTADASVDGGTEARLLPALSPVCVQAPIGVDGSRTLLVSYHGEAPVTLSATLEGSERFLFSASAPSPLTIGDGETSSIEVGFRAAREGWASVRVRVLTTETASAAIRVYGLGLPVQGGAFDAGPLPNGATCP